MKQLSDEELRDVLARAEEIDRSSRRGSAWKAEVAWTPPRGRSLALLSPRW